MASTADHVIARKVFFERDRMDLPKVPACMACNGEKSRLENYFLAMVLAASNHADSDAYRRDFVMPRLRKNRKFQHAINTAKPTVIQRDGRFQQVYAIHIEADKTTRLMEMISLGLYHHHAGQPLQDSYDAVARIFTPEGETDFLAMTREEFPEDSPIVRGNLGDGAFAYEGIQHSELVGFSVWRMIWHGGIALAGDDGPPGGVNTWVVWTRPRD